MKKCVGRGGVICRKCDKLRFSSISELIEHNSNMHQYNGDFFEKVIEFNPKKKNLMISEEPKILLIMISVIFLQ